jgi:signal transduction histidine kinase
MAKLDAHAIDFIKNDIRTSELLEAVKPSVEILLDIHSLTIELKQDCIIHCDKRWTTEALTNIIKNAIEYSPDGSVIDGVHPYRWSTSMRAFQAVRQPMHPLHRNRS